MRLLLLNSVPYHCFEVCERQFKLTSNEFAMFLRVCKTGSVNSFLSPLYGTLKILINQKNYNVIFESCDSLVSLTNAVSDLTISIHYDRTIPLKNQLLNRNLLFLLVCSGGSN